MSSKAKPLGVNKDDTRQQSDQLPKFLYDEIPAEITNANALKSRIKNDDDKISPYSFTGQGNNKTKVKESPKLNLKVDTSLDSLDPHNNANRHTSIVKQKGSLENMLLEIPNQATVGLGIDPNPSPIYDQVSQKIGNILSNSDSPVPIPFSSPIQNSYATFNNDTQATDADQFEISEINSSDYGQPKDSELSFISQNKSYSDSKDPQFQMNTDPVYNSSFNEFSFSEGDSANQGNTTSRSNHSTPHPYRMAATKNVATPASQGSAGAQNAYTASPISIRHSKTNSNSSSISHSSSSQPSYWTLENVVQFLQTNGFNDSWIDVFIARNLIHDAFLRLQNYEVLKTYIPFMDTTGDSTPSRFIQVLRKTVDRQSSLNSIVNQTVISVPKIIEQSDVPSPKTAVVENVHSDDAESFGELESITSSKNFDSHPDDILPSVEIGEKLVPVVSAPLLSSQNSVSKIPAKKQESMASASIPRRITDTKQRPVSTIERSSVSSVYAQSSPNTSKSFFKKQHNKSISPESSTYMSGQPYDSSSNSSTIDIFNSYSYKKHSRASSKGSIKVEDATTPKSIFNKFFSKTKLGDIPYSLSRGGTGGVDSPVSPSSYFTLGSSSPDLPKKEYKVPKTQRKPPPDIETSKSSISSSSSKSVPKFEKIGPVGKKPQPTGATIPVKTSAPSVTKTSVTPTSGNLPQQSTLTGPPVDIFPEFKSSDDNGALKSVSQSKEGKPTVVAKKDLDPKFYPIPKSSKSDTFIMVTNSGSSFVPVNVSLIQSAVALRSLLIKSLGLKLSANVTFHLTDLGSEPGAALDDESFDHIIKSSFLDGKCFIHVKEKHVNGLDIPLRQSSKSISESFTSDTSGERGYPSTPQYLINGSSIKHRDSIDYLNFKEQFGTISEMTPNTLRDYITQKDFILKEGNLSGNTFRVIRPEKSEIDFDKRRDSPFTSNPAPHRTPPPPPLSHNSSIKSLQKSPKKLSRKPPPANADDTSSLSSTGDTLSSKSIKRGNMLMSRKSTIKRKASTKTKGFDPFKEYDLDSSIANAFENSSTFAGSDEDGDDSDSDDGLFAKAPTSNDNTVLSREETSTNSSNNSSAMEVRPPPEVVYDNLERYFPNTDLDELIIDEVSSPPVSPINENVQSSTPKESIAPQLPERPKYITGAKTNLALPVDTSSKSGKVHRMKSIRIVAQEAARRASVKHMAAVQSQKTNAKSDNSKLLRRTSTKMWGQRVVEVTPGNAKIQHFNKLQNQNGQYKEFAWVKGELIGIGTFGKVYLALNVTTGEMIAVKQTKISSQFLNKAETTKIVDTFKAEVNSLKDLDHVNIVQYLGFEMKGNTYSIFLEYVSGGSVGSCIRAYGKFPEELIRFLTIQILEGLDYIHSQGILHRDLKADNLLLEVDGNCKISDFGISKKTKDIYANDSALSFQGTVFWMAPEVVNNTVHKGYNAKVDIWSVGCVVLEMFAGERPWHDFAMAAAILKLGKNAAPPIPKAVLQIMSPEGKNFLDKCFEIDPSKRPTASELLKHDFCKVNPSFKFSDTDLARKMKSDDNLEAKRAEMIHDNETGKK